MRLISASERVAAAHKMAEEKPERRRSAVTKVILKKYALEATDRLYIRLICDHYTTPQEVEMLWTFNPDKGKKFWCGICGKWVLRKPKQETAKLPDKPMF